MKRLRGKLTYANVMVTILAFVVLCGGAAVAAEQLGRNTVGTPQLKKNAVTSAKVKDGSLQPKDFGKFGSGLAVVGPAGPQGERGSEGPQGQEGRRGPEGPRGTSDAYQATGAAGPLSSSLFGTQVVNLAVPPGSYFAISTFEANTSDGLSGAVNCRLINAGGVASFGPSRFQAIRFPDVENVTLASGLNVGAGESISLQCNQEGPSVQVNVLRANIVAVEITELTGSSG